MLPPICSAQMELPLGDRQEFASLLESVAEMRGSSRLGAKMLGFSSA